MALSSREANLSKLLLICDNLKIDSKVMDAIIQTESAWDPWAVRFEIDYRYLVNPDKYSKLNSISEGTEIALQKMSWGLGQIMGANCRSYNFDGPLQSLADPKLSLQFSCMHFRNICKRFDSFEDRIAAYNAGTPSNLANGKYKNQGYVDKVLSAYAKL